MLDPTVLKVAASWAVVKGVAISTVVGSADIGFANQIIIASVSGLLGAGGVIVGAFVAARESRKTRSAVRDVSRKIGADRRAADQTDRARENPPDPDC